MSAVIHKHLLDSCNLATPGRLQQSIEIGIKTNAEILAPIQSRVLNAHFGVCLSMLRLWTTMVWLCLAVGSQWSPLMNSFLWGHGLIIS